MDKKILITIVIAAIVAIVAGIGIIYGVATHEEEPLLPVCWVSGEAIYQEGTADIESEQDCPTPVPLRWREDLRPLKVSVAKVSGGETGRAPAEEWQHRVTDAAIKALNAQVGCLVWQHVDEATSPAWVGVEFGHPAEKGKSVADCHHTTADGTNLAHSAIIRLRNIGNEAEATSIVAHELGHAAGLAHVDDQSAVMRRLQPDELLPGLPTLYLTDTAVDALQQEFCRGRND